MRSKRQTEQEGRARTRFECEAKDAECRNDTGSATPMVFWAVHAQRVDRPEPCYLARASNSSALLLYVCWGGGSSSIACAVLFAMLSVKSTAAVQFPQLNEEGKGSDSAPGLHENREHTAVCMCCVGVVVLQGRVDVFVFSELHTVATGVKHQGS